MSSTVNNVDFGKTGLSEESKSDKQESKVNTAKKKKKPSPGKKKDVKTAATDSSEVVGEEVSIKPSSKVKKEKKTNLKVSNLLMIFDKKMMRVISIRI